MNNKNYLEFIPPKSEINLCFVHFSTSNIHQYAIHSYKNIKAYIKKYGYGLYSFDEKILFSEKMYHCWGKINSICEVLPLHDYIVWIDADAIVNNFEVDIFSFVDNNDLYLNLDIDIDNQGINSGVMIIKNTKWSKDIFNRVKNTNKPKMHNDQSVLLDEILLESTPGYITKKEVYSKNNKFLLHEGFINNKIHSKVKTFKNFEFNTPLEKFTEDTFILHLMGEEILTREKIIKNLNLKLGIDKFT